MTAPLIRAFVGYVPTEDVIEGVVAPPVSSITADRYEQLVADNPDSILHLLGSAIDTGEGGADPSLFDMRGATRLADMIDKGILEKQPEALYVLRVTAGKTTHTGLVCEVNTCGVDDGRIRRHEHTRSETEELVVDHLNIVGAHTDPVAMTHRDHAGLDALIDEVVERDLPARDFTTDDGSRQQLWRISDVFTLDRARSLLAEIPAIYITDGHHRTAAAARLRARRSERNEGHTGHEAYNYLLTVLFAESELELHGYNRAVMDLGGMTPAEVMEKIDAVAEVEEIAVAWAQEAEPRSRGIVSMLLGEHWYRITWRPEDVPEDPRGALDAVLLQDLILGPVLGIEDARADHRLHYIPGPAGLAELEHHDAAIAFALHAASVDDVMAVADAGEVMPPKSTWFAPKVKTGLVARLINEL